MQSNQLKNVVSKIVVRKQRRGLDGEKKFTFATLKKETCQNLP